jgi:hypothetical protein
LNEAARAASFNVRAVWVINPSLKAVKGKFYFHSHTLV